MSSHPNSALLKICPKLSFSIGFEHGELVVWAHVSAGEHSFDRKLVSDEARLLAVMITAASPVEIKRD